MSFFIDKHNRRKSPIALAAFGVALLELCVFGALYAFLAEPLEQMILLPSILVTNVIHVLIVSVIGTAISCLLFFLPDKRVAPYGFAGLAMVLVMFCIAALMLDPSVRGGMLQLIALYLLLPVLVGNAVTWLIYSEMKRRNPAMNDRKTLAEELREAAEKEAAKHPERKTEEDSEASEEPEENEFPEISATEAMFGPEDNSHYFAEHSAQEEAMLLYFDEDEDEESDD